MIRLTVLRPSLHGPREVEATYEKAHWACEDKNWLSLLNTFALGMEFDMAYYPDREMALVEKVAKQYCGTIKDERPKGPLTYVPDRIY